MRRGNAKVLAPAVRVALAMGVALAVSTAIAQVERSGGGESQRIIQQYQQVSAEKVALQEQVTKLQADLTAAKAETEAAKKERDALKARAGGEAAANAKLAAMAASNTAAEKGLEQYKARLAELVDKFREMAGNLRQVEQDRDKTRRDLEERNVQFDKCADDNLQLYEISGDVLNRYEHVGVFTRTSAAEPFTKITRTRIENLVDGYRERAQSLRTKKRASP